MSSRSFGFHTARVLLLAALAALAGWVTGHPLTVFATAATVFVAWQAVNVWRLHRWVRNPAADAPRSRGVWGDIYRALAAAQERNRIQQDKCRAKVDEFGDLTNALPYATLTIDENGTVTWFNSTAEQLLGLNNPGDLGRKITSLIRGDDFADWLAVQDEFEHPFEMPSPRGGRRWLTVNSVAMKKRRRLVVLRDTTETHHLDKMRRDFVANISHELRTPLTVVHGYLELLEEHPDGDVVEAVGKMQQQTVHMQSLLNDLLELSRVQAGELHGEEGAVDVGRLLAVLESQAEDLSRGRHEILFQVDQELRVSGVAADLESAFSNLVSNAVKYTPERGKIEVQWADSADGPRLTIRDEGIGIPTRDIPRVTERFYRVGSDRGRKTGGTGLGLAIVKHVLNAHQADLAIESVLGVGSTFTVTFPPERECR